MSLNGIFPIEQWNFNTPDIFSCLTETEYHNLITKQGAQKYEKGQTLFKEGMVPTNICFIHQGKVKKYKIGPAGKEQIIYVAHKNELIGYHAVLAGERYPDSAATLEESIITFIPREDFLQALRHSNAFATRLLKALSHEYAVLANHISLSTQGTAAERLATALILLREKSKTETAAGEAPVIDLSRTDLANMAGIAKENVIRLLKEFKTEQILETDGRKIFVKNIAKLVSRAGIR
ncbi:CRP-like cAMP-binding protein [Pedobacter africanus]|uniref:CRP-like cAMP-binding protein n=1 Tax=Pedobacter africanus TaxID=151894 RepID=A0ACC6KUF8_9SPHI|nr:Crp/Fnr family transcriptional regulator [Pedobacter africanus]MDR6782774.1 CRP-like cAMP-binding protein [Pedobacter africanus]